MADERYPTYLPDRVQSHYATPLAYSYLYKQFRLYLLDKGANNVGYYSRCELRTSHSQGWRS